MVPLAIRKLRHSTHLRVLFLVMYHVRVNWWGRSSVVQFGWPVSAPNRLRNFMNMKSVLHYISVLSFLFCVCLLWAQPLGWGLLLWSKMQRLSSPEYLLVISAGMENICGWHVMKVKIEGHEMPKWNWKRNIEINNSPLKKASNKKPEKENNLLLLSLWSPSFITYSHYSNWSKSWLLLDKIQMEEELVQVSNKLRNVTPHKIFNS